jgi:hypothetical protein
MGYNLLAMLVPEVQPNCDTAPLLTPNHTESIRLRSETARRLRIESNRIFRCRNAYGGMQWAAIRHADAVTGTCLLFGRFSLSTLHRVWHVRQCALKVAGTAICENEGGFWGKYCETSDEQFRFSDAPLPPVMHLSAVSITGGLRCRPLPGKLMAYAALGQGAHPESHSVSSGNRAQSIRCLRVFSCTE